MSETAADATQGRTPLRLWPAVAIVAVVWLARLAAPVVDAGATTEFMIRILGGFLGAAAVLVWWLFFSRAAWSERIGFIALVIAVLFVTWLTGHESIFVWLIWYSAAILSLTFVAAAVIGRRLANGPRRALMAVAIVLTCAAATLFRIVGVTGNGVAQFQWRWTPTAEEQLIARAPVEPHAPPPAVEAQAPPATSSREQTVIPESSASPVVPAARPSSSEEPILWPGFRGSERNSVVTGVRINTDWSTKPPVPLWRREVGPGWSSFAVRDDVFFTQEQRGNEEVTAAYRVQTGAPVWRHVDRVRFEEAMGGPGPRSTPTLTRNRVYTFGPTGILNVLDAATGAVLWSRDVASELRVPVPMWGFASSPIVVDDLVIVAVSGKLAAYAIENGAPRWTAEDGGESYSSPQLTTIDGVTQVLLMNAAGTTGIAPADGKVLWQYPWNSRMPIVPIVQPGQIAAGNLLIGDSMFGVRRVVVQQGPAGWTANEQWISNRLKPYFNDFVLHRGHAYGFDGAILASVDLADGARKWKGGRYGQGQLLLLADQDLLLVLSEEGELALVKATPDQFTELARFSAISGKTWNHPVLAGDVLLVRNGEQMAAFRLATTPSPQAPEAISLLGKPLLSAPPTGEAKARLEANLAKARADYERDPASAENAIWLGRRLAYLGRFRDAIDIYSRGIENHPNEPRLYRHRGHRYITLRQFDRAIIDLRRASTLIAGKPDEIEPDGAPNAAGIPRSTLQSNIWYHLGLAQYLSGDFRSALDSYRAGMKVSRVNDDMLVATSDWLYMTLRRLGRDADAKQVLEPIVEKMDILENTAYQARLLMYKGLRTPDSVLNLNTADDVQIATQGYGVGNWYLVNGDKAKARQIFERVVAGSAWQAFGFIAAEADLKRGF